MTLKKVTHYREGCTMYTFLKNRNPVSLIRLEVTFYFLFTLKYLIPEWNPPGLGSYYNIL